jgi:hypothetical protein
MADLSLSEAGLVLVLLVCSVSLERYVAEKRESSSLFVVDLCVAAENLDLQLLGLGQWAAVVFLEYAVLVQWVMRDQRVVLTQVIARFARSFVAQRVV